MGYVQEMEDIKKIEKEIKELTKQKIRAKNNKKREIAKKITELIDKKQKMKKNK